MTKDKGSDGVRKLDSEGKSTGRLITVQLDVTSDEQVEAAVRTVKTKIPPGTNVIHSNDEVHTVFDFLIIYFSILGSLGCCEQRWILNFW